MPRARRNRRAATPSTVVTPSTAAGSEAEEEEGPAIEVVELEQPFGHPHRFQALKEAYEPGKRRSTNAYDDIVCKRRKIDSQLGVQLPMLQSTGRARRSPSTTTSSRAARKARTNAFVADMRAQHEKEQARILAPSPKSFSDLPTEIRGLIFRYLLVYYKPILVLRGWEYVYPRGRPNLHTGLLGVCRDFYYQGLRILYGENTFRYRTRDPSDGHQDTHKVMRKVYEDDGNTIPVQKHGHLIRNIEIDIEANRMQDAKNRLRVVDALAKFLPDQPSAIPAQLRMVTLEIYLETRKTLRMETSPTQPKDSYPAVEFFVSHSDVLAHLQKMNCQFVRIVAHRSQDPLVYECVVDRRPHFTAMDVAKGGIKDIWAYDEAMLETRRQSANQSRARLQAMHIWLERLIRDPYRLLKKTKVFRAYIPEPEKHDHQSIPNSPRKRRAKAPKKTEVQAQPAAGLLTEENLKCVAGSSNWASVGQFAHTYRPEDITVFTGEHERLEDRVARLMGPRPEEIESY